MSQCSVEVRMEGEVIYLSAVPYLVLWWACERVFYI